MKLKQLWGRCKHLTLGARRVVVAGVACLFVLGVTDSVWLFGFALVVSMVVLSMRPSPAQLAEWEPTPEQLAAIDADRAEEDEAAYLQSGEGDLLYEQTLHALLDLVGKHVTVLVGSGGATWRAKAILVGELGPAHNQATDSSYELLMFTVGTTGAGALRSGFYVDRERFARGHARVRRGEDDGLELFSTDGSVVWIFEAARVDA